MVAPISTSGLVKPKRFSYTVSCTIDRPLAWVRATTSGCCQSVMNPGCTSVSIATGFKSPPGCQKRMPLSVTSNLPPTLRNTLRNVIISGWVAPLTKISPCVASAADAQDAASMRSVSDVCVYPCSSLTPSMRKVRSTSTEMIAPIFCSTHTRSMISGSVAAPDSSVLPSASTAASKVCSVAPTDG